MSAPWQFPPIYFALVQVRFNPVLTLAEFMPRIQEAFRQIGYSDYRYNSTYVFPSDGSEGQPVPVSQTVYLFGNLEKKASFVLTSNSLAFQTTEYGHFENFSEIFLRGVALVNEILALNFIERIGIRFLDRIIPIGDDAIEKYVADEVLWLPRQLGGFSSSAFFEAVQHVSGFNLISRVAVLSGGLLFPPDLQGVDMVVNERLSSYNGLNILVDTDCFVEARTPFKLDIISEKMTGAHTVLRDSFLKIVSEYAIGVWKG